MEGRARAPGAGTVLNALATGVGAAFAIDVSTTALVELTREAGVDGRIEGHPDGDTTLIETCVRGALDRYGTGEYRGGQVVTESELPLAAGLKSSSAAANATVLATLDALGKVDDVDRLEAARVGVDAARSAGVTITGAFDDASASMLGGVTITDNDADQLVEHEAFDHAVAIYTPTERAYSAEADVERCTRIAPIASLVRELAEAGRYGIAMTLNGFAYSAALGFPADRMLEALPDVYGVSLSGTGPSTVAVGTEEAIRAVANEWEEHPGTVRLTATQNTGACVA